MQDRSSTGESVRPLETALLAAMAAPDGETYRGRLLDALRRCRAELPGPALPDAVRLLRLDRPGDRLLLRAFADTAGRSSSVEERAGFARLLGGLCAGCVVRRTAPDPESLLAILRGATAAAVALLAALGPDGGRVLPEVLAWVIGTARGHDLQGRQVAALIEEAAGRVIQSARAAERLARPIPEARALLREAGIPMTGAPTPAGPRAALQPEEGWA